MHNLSLGDAKNVIPILLALFWHAKARKNIKSTVSMLGMWLCDLTWLNASFWEIKCGDYM